VAVVAWELRAVPAGDVLAGAAWELRAVPAGDVLAGVAWELRAVPAGDVLAGVRMAGCWDAPSWGPAARGRKPVFKKSTSERKA